MTPALLWICSVLTVLLAAYSLGHYLCVGVFLGARTPARPGPAPAEPIAVLVPARNEGPAAVRVIQSLLAQDHRGPIEIHLLLEDASDTSVPFLEAEWPALGQRAPGATTAQVRLGSDRRLIVAFTGHGPKSEKLNWAIPGITAPFTAILDCDHRAHPDWIGTSIAVMRERGARFVQGRRGPLSARGLFGLWDALHQHIGCELFNVAFTRAGLTVFFTGTTVVAETSLLAANPFRPCITEDVDLSYDLLLQGVKIAYNPHSGSDEEVSPDLYSFLARRRRWSNGHTEAFFRHLPRLPAAPLGLSDKVQFLFHGAHYLVSLVVFWLHLLIGLIFLDDLPVAARLGALGSSLLLALLVVRTQRSARWGTWLSELLVVLGWLFPAVVIATNLTVAGLVGELGRAALPIPAAVQIVGLVGLVAPLVLLLAGLAGFRQLGLGSLLAVVLTYPLAFYLDVTGVLVGLADFALGRKTWHAVARAPQAIAPAKVPDTTWAAPALGIRASWEPALVLGSSPRGLRRTMQRLMKPSRWIPVTLMLAVFCGGVLYAPTGRIELAENGCEVLEHDDHPWIVAPRKLEGYCDAAGAPHPAQYSRRTSSFTPTRHDELQPVDPAFWDELDDTFFCNDATFSPENVRPLDDGGIRLLLTPEPRGDRAYTAGSIATKTDPEAKFRYGRFEVVMKPAKASGVLSAFFLYRFDPWQEIDTEFVGRDTTKILLNVYYNPGDEGDLYNYGYRGTPVLVDLGFDASEDFHHYALEWDVDEIRWFVDGKLIHRREAGRPTPIPHLPMRLYVNTWPICSAELAGPLDAASLPVATDIRSITLSAAEPTAASGLSALVQHLLPAEERQGFWQDDASWIQPGR